MSLAESSWHPKEFDRMCQRHVPGALVCDKSLAEASCKTKLAALQVQICTLQLSLHALQFCDLPCIASRPNLYTAWLCMMLQGELEDKRRAQKQQGERADLAHKALHDRQAELEVAYQRITAAEAASREGKNKTQVMLQPCLRVDVFHSFWNRPSVNLVWFHMSLDPFCRSL